jgi:hypothetical protein
LRRSERAVLIVSGAQNANVVLDSWFVHIDYSLSFIPVTSKRVWINVEYLSVTLSSDNQRQKQRKTKKLAKCHL